MAAQGSMGTSMKQNDGAMLEMGQALHRLVGRLVRSHKEFQNVEDILDSEIDAGFYNEFPTNSVIEIWPQLVLVVDEVENLLSLIQHNFGGKFSALADVFQDVIVSEDPPAEHPPSLDPHEQPPVEHPTGDPSSSSVDISRSSTGMPVCTSNKDLQLAIRVSGKSQRLCKHWCEDHPELMDPGVWRNLPHEVLQLVLAKLPLPQIIELYKSSETWSALSNLSTFRAARAEGHPKLFGLVGCDPHSSEPYITIHDRKSGEWLTFDMADFPERDDFPWTDDFFYSCDGGLVCFVPMDHLFDSPILVCNPLTGIGKILPLLHLEDFDTQNILMVQLLMESDQDCYRLILVTQDNIIESVFSAHVYNSRTDVWSSMDSGLVYGAGFDWKYGVDIPHIFDCSKKQLFDLTQCASLARLNGISAYSVAKDRVFVLHQSEAAGRRGDPVYLVSECTWDSSISDLRVLNAHETPVRIWQDPYKAKLCACPGSMLVFADNCAESHEDHHQLIGRYDGSTKQWDIPPPVPYGKKILYDQLESTFLCELRWNAIP